MLSFQINEIITNNKIFYSNMNSITSIYIPRISIIHNENSIREIMYQCQIGEVSYIDFTPINKRPGFVEIHDEKFMSAFVHFSRPWLKNCDFWDIIASEKPYKIQVSSREYWICLKNKNPVQRTMMNIHQVVDNGRHLENLIEDQSKKISELENKLKCVHAVVYQFTYGLFNMDQQRLSLQRHIDVLRGNESVTDYYDFVDKSRWSNMPTTRQGDECEKKLKELEERLRNLESGTGLGYEIYTKYLYKELSKEREKIEYEMNYYENNENNDEEMERLKKEADKIHREQVKLSKSYEAKTGLPFSHLFT
jgi:hypothetical protein